MDPTTTTPAPEGKIIDDLLSTSQVAKLLKKSKLTISNWRYRGCPYVRIKGAERDAIRFCIREVVAWAKKNGKDIPSRLAAA